MGLSEVTRIPGRRVGWRPVVMLVFLRTSSRFSSFTLPTAAERSRSVPGNAQSRFVVRVTSAICMQSERSDTHTARSYFRLSHINQHPSRKKYSSVTYLAV